MKLTLPSLSSAGLPGRRSGLEGRRQTVHFRRLAACLCAGLAVFCVLQTLGGASSRTPVLTAARRVERGTRISPEMLHTESIPTSGLTGKLLSRPDEAVGMTTLTDLESGQPIAGTALTRVPPPPVGTTTVRLSLSSAPESMLPGQHVRLVSSTGCDGKSGQEGLQTGDGKEGAQSQGACAIAREATIMALPQTKGKPDPLGTVGKDSDSGMTAFALKPDDAIKALSLPEGAPIIAVATGGS
ncbi:SAF domain-containing protein [Bifidobacterium xylocopae]|uniref:SAF domain-containing protein n=1 Tax=Bifidobacterium xylocopae TaxID=2493119 RepID=A0A366KDV7_9BIFI|nr:SAF domain-containing protein [Bifidobacterium xylocopae]RBP99368.1 hypothetical protein CRD59_03970 [Bifidobacterium xylocopae]